MPWEAKADFGVLFIALALLSRRTTRRFSRAVERVKPKLARGLRTERVAVDVICAVMILVGVAFLITV